MERSPYGAFAGIFAATLFTLMAGNAPYARRKDEPAIAVITRASQEPVPDLRARGIPDAVCAVVEDAMAKRPDDSF